MQKIRCLRQLLLFFAFVFAMEGYSTSSYSLPNYAKEEASGPWFTGPLLTPSPTVIPVGEINLEPYLFATKASHIYNKHWHKEHVPTFVNVNTQIFLQVGFVKDWDFYIVPEVAWNHSKGQAKTVFADLPIGLEYQLVSLKTHEWFPETKVGLYEIFPTGKYQHLDPKKNGTDVGGNGSFGTQAAVVIGKLFYFGHLHWLNTRLNLNYTYFAPVHVSGFSVYGGSRNTKGKVYPGNQFDALIGLEFTFNLRWVLALDLSYEHMNKSPFRGRKGESAPGVEAKVGFPSFEEFSLAPAIEYNWNSSMGIIAGAWFTVAGRNTPDFLSWVVAFNWYY